MDQTLNAVSALVALGDVDFDWTRTLPSIWDDWIYHVEELHKPIADRLIREFIAKTSSLDSAPIGWVIGGPAGVGKTHFIGSLRQRVWACGGWFVLLDLVDINNFWPATVLGFVSSLQRRMPDGRTQCEAIIERIAADLPVDPTVTAGIAGLSQRSKPVDADIISGLLGPLRRRYPQHVLQHHDVLRALLLLSSSDSIAADVVSNWLQGHEIEKDWKRQLGFMRAQITPIELVRGISWAMSLVGPTLIAVDQIDALVSIYNLCSGSGAEPSTDSERKALSIVETVVGRLMDLHEIKHRALTVVSCLEGTWQILKDKAIKSAADRFHEVCTLNEIPSCRIAELIVSNRLRVACAKHRFTPPYSTWPFLPEAFETAVNFLPRAILRRCEEHRKKCLAEGKITELLSFAEIPTPSLATTSALDTTFERFQAVAKTDHLLDPAKEDRIFCNLLLDVLRVYVRQTETPANVDLTVDADLDQRRPSLHGRLRFVYRDENDREQHYCFRALGHSSATAVQARLRAAMTASGIDHALKFRRLFILRRGPLPSGRVTDRLAADLERAGGCLIAPTDNDLRTFVALQDLLHQAPEGFEDWLRARRPLSQTEFFEKIGLCRLLSMERKPVVENGGPTPATNLRVVHKLSPPAATPTILFVGAKSIGSRRPEPTLLPVIFLPRHTAVLAGSGSGKTVLLRRIVEEAALLGIPSIVLDTNNDLARLGEPWPKRPSRWIDEDHAKAKSYAKKVEVVVWTPGLSTGNPIVLSPLPQFEAVRDDRDELAKAVEMARATLFPVVGVGGQKGKLKGGVLADALRAFAAAKRGGLQEFIVSLSDLPDGVSDIDGASSLASEIANQLRAAIAMNPLLAGEGTQLDPGRLLTAAKAGKTRISVINFSGLSSDEARQDFVNQLQMALFTWIKRNPSPKGRPINGLFVLDEAQNFAPAQAATACKSTTLSLVAQARKYGLGMIFATQHPKGIDNKIISNCTTQFYGKMSAPATIAAVRELMAAKGGAADDIGKLTTGQFYFSTEGIAKPVKLEIPLCLTYHPENPLSETEVISRAAKSRLKNR